MFKGIRKFISLGFPDFQKIMFLGLLGIIFNAIEKGDFVPGDFVPVQGVTESVEMFHPSPCPFKLPYHAPGDMAEDLISVSVAVSLLSTFC